MPTRPVEPKRAIRLVAALVASVLGGCALAHERAFDATVDVGPATPESLCASSGGRWRDGPCCPTECGRECPLACVSSNCACAADEVWDTTRGCVVSPTCS